MKDDECQFSLSCQLPALLLHVKRSMTNRFLLFLQPREEEKKRLKEILKISFKFLTCNQRPYSTWGRSSSCGCIFLHTQKILSIFPLFEEKQNVSLIARCVVLRLWRRRTQMNESTVLIFSLIYFSCFVHFFHWFIHLIPTFLPGHLLITVID